MEVTKKSKAVDWTAVCKRLMWIVATLRHREDFTDDKIIIVGLQIDEWSEKWIDLVGNESMTNCTHCLTSGRVFYYLKL
jgi:hypothetical protein